MRARHLALVTGILLSAAGTAQADFGDCDDREYLSQFGTEESGGSPTGAIQSLTCVVEFEFEIPTPSGPRRIRAIRDINADWAFQPGALAEMERGARAAGAAMQQLGGGWAVDDITFLILDNTYSTDELGPDPSGTVGAITSDQRDGSECRITSYFLGRGGGLEHVATVAAHEMFHCVQLATLTPAQTATSQSGGRWWVEGSADYFAVFAVPGSPFPAYRTEGFEEAVAGEVPLYEQTYEMSVFFYWLHAQRGISGLMPFLHAMASGDSAGSQRAAMRGVLTDDEWREFAQAYADRDITAPDGTALPFGGAEGDEFSFDRNRSERFSLSPFVLKRGWATYTCGRWENTLRPDSANIGGRIESESDWQRYPQDVDSNEAPQIRVRFAALHTGDSDQQVRLKAERKVSCAPCAGSREVDACVVGTWEMTGGGPVEWMRRQGINIPSANTGSRVMHLADDGTYYTNPFGTDITVRLGEDIGYGEGTALPGAGRWSIAGGRLAICQDSGGMQGTVTVKGITMPVSQPGGGELIHSFTCGRTTMSATHSAAGSPMETTYTRLSPPPEDD